MSTISTDQEVKIFRQLVAEHRQLSANNQSTEIIYQSILNRYGELMNSYSNPQSIENAKNNFQCPKPDSPRCLKTGS